jgi:hypothetical protein
MFSLIFTSAAQGVLCGFHFATRTKLGKRHESHFVRTEEVYATPQATYREISKGNEPDEETSKEKKQRRKRVEGKRARPR